MSDDIYSSRRWRRTRRGESTTAEEYVELLKGEMSSEEYVRLLRLRYVDLDAFRLSDGRVMVIPGTPGHRVPEEYVPAAGRLRSPYAEPYAERDLLEAAIKRAIRYLDEGDEQHAAGTLRQALVDVGPL